MEDCEYYGESSKTCEGYELVEDRRVGSDIPTCRCSYRLCSSFSGYCPVRDS